MALADFKNVSIVAHYIKERTRNAQFIIISLRNNMFELADRLVPFCPFIFPWLRLSWRRLLGAGCVSVVGLLMTRPFAEWDARGTCL